MKSYLKFSLTRSHCYVLFWSNASSAIGSLLDGNRVKLRLITYSFFVKRFTIDCLPAFNLKIDDKNCFNKNEAQDAVIITTKSLNNNDYCY